MALLNRGLLAGAALICALAMYLAISRMGQYMPFGAICAIGVPLAAAIILIYAAWRMRISGARRIARELVAVGFTLLAVEFLIEMWAPNLPSTQLARAKVAKKLGVDFDFRTKTEVLTALREEGVDALPGISREWPLQPRVRQQLPDGMFPLSHASNATIVECNESGRYLLLHTDEFGFNNPTGLIASGDIDIAAVGASFTLGHCVAAEHSLLGRLRATYPKIANFGMAGSATLSMLATFREYVEPLKPPVVLWIMHPLTADLRQEGVDPVLQNYLAPTFSQGLMTNQAAVDRVWRKIAIPVQHEFDRRSKQVIDDSAGFHFRRMLFLSEVRQRFAFDTGWRRPPPPADLHPFGNALRLARRTTESWGGKFVVLIMPLYAETVAHQMQESLQHDRLARLLESDGMEVIDVAGFALAQRDPRDLFTMRISNHPDPRGYALLTDFVLKEMQRRFPAEMNAAQHNGATE